MMKFVRDPNFSNDFGTTEPKKITYLSKENAQKLMDANIQKMIKNVLNAILTIIA